MGRQFPDVQGRDVDAVHDVVARVGPIQSQTARSPFVALAARMPGVTLSTITAAYEQGVIVRGSTIRGTVHTSTGADHIVLEAATRLGNRALWSRTAQLKQATLEDLWAGIESYCAPEWRTPEQIREHVHGWVATFDPAATPRFDGQAGRSMVLGHGGLLRRPLTGGWQAQGAPGYRTASTVLDDREARSLVLDNRESAVDAAVRWHLSAHGPASRHDIKWWSGIGLRDIDAAVDRLADQLDAVTGPDGRTYLDLRGAPPARDLPGVRLLPEFDALLCGYDPPARQRFVDEAHYPRLWHQNNGLIRAPLMVDGRLTGWWRLGGSGARRPLTVSWFSRTRRPRKSELDQPIRDLETAYGVTVDSLSLARE
nr:winged helix DNA-binding domain-containing protein [Dermacoccus abyssi]